mgnify:FL=1
MFPTLDDLLDGLEGLPPELKQQYIDRYESIDRSRATAALAAEQREREVRRRLRMEEREMQLRAGEVGGSTSGAFSVGGAVFSSPLQQGQVPGPSWSQGMSYAQPLGGASVSEGSSILGGGAAMQTRPQPMMMGSSDPFGSPSRGSSVFGMASPGGFTGFGAEADHVDMVQVNGSVTQQQRQQQQQASHLGEDGLDEGMDDMVLMVFPTLASLAEKLSMLPNNLQWNCVQNYLRIPRDKTQTQVPHISAFAQDTASVVRFCSPPLTMVVVLTQLGTPP